MSNQGLYDTVLFKEERSDDFNTYSYELIMRKGDSTACWRMPLYSIKVIMTDAKGNEKSADARDVFSNLDKAREFFKKIVNNLATPIDLAYILEDEMSV